MLLNRIRTGGRNRVEFDEPTHKYTCVGRNYISGTTILGLLKPNKCWWGIAYKYAKKNGGTVAFWLQEWKKETIKGTTRGSKFHDAREKKINEGEGMVSHGEHQPVRDHSKVKWLSELGPGTYAELRLWCHHAEIAGTADLVIIHNDRSVSIYDWKTNKHIKKGYNYIDKYTGKEIINSYMKAPVDHLVDCEYSHYQLQLSLYAWMIEIEGFTIRNLAFIHITDNNKVYHCDYLRDEIQQVVDWYVH